MRSTLGVLGVLGVLVSCGGSGGGGEGWSSSPLAASEHALTVASRGEALAFARTLASEPRGSAEVDIQLELLGEWLYLRGLSGAEVDGATLDGWDAPRLEASTSSTATVATVLRFRHAAEQPFERPVPLEIDLARERGAWRIADVRVKPLPGWYKTRHEEQDPTFPGETPEPVPPPPTLLEIARTFRPPPKNWKR